MTAPAAFTATFCDFRLVKGRKQAQLVFEVPLESADAALKALGGVPMPDESRWFAIARMQTTPSGAQAHEPGNPPAGEHEGNARPERRRFRELPLSQQAALLCQDVAFQRWMGTRGRPEMSAEDTARHLREKLHVQSRAELDTDTKAAAQFADIRDQFEREAGRVPDFR